MYLTDDRFLGALLANGSFCGEPMLASGCEAVIDRGFTLSNSYIVFGEKLTNVVVKGDVTLAGNNAYLSVGANTRLANIVRSFTFTTTDAIPAPRLEIGGNLTLTMGARMDLLAVGFSGSDGTAAGGCLDVKGDIAMSGQAKDQAKNLPALTSIVYCASAPLIGNSYRVYATNITIGAEARFDATERGFQTKNNSNANNSSCYGPGKGSGCGASYGGLGVSAENSKLYGDEDRPDMPGSSGRYDWAAGGAGGGYLRVAAYDTMTVDGQFTANGGNGGRGFAGSGGGMLIEARTLVTSPSAVFSARGGSGTDSSYPTGRAGGGGRIAVWIGAPGCELEDMISYSATEQAETGAAAATFDVRGGVSYNLASTGGVGTVTFFNAVPKGQNLDVVFDPLDAFGTSDPAVGSHSLAQGSYVFTATDVTNDLTHVRSRCTGWTLEKLNPFTQMYEEYQNGNTATCGFSMDENVYRLTWKWTKEALLTLTVNEGGTVTKTEAPKDAGWYALGSSVTFNAGENSGYVFTMWSGDVADVDSLNNPLTLAMDAAKSLTCNFQAAVPGGQTFTWNGGAANGKWYDPRNWRNAGDQQGFPVAEDTAIIPADAGTILLDRPTAPLTELTLNSGVTLVLTNWTTAVNANTVNVRSGAKITCAGPFADRYTAAYQNIDMSNRVWIVCKDLNLDAGGVIDADGKGYGEPTTISSNSARSYGPGGTGNRGCGGAHGGIGQRRDNATYASEYDSLTEPELPGSSGGIGGGDADYCRAGGGVVRVEATGTVALNGTITAKGVSGSANKSGSGAGGTIYLSAKKFTADGGVVSAAGGGASDSYTHGGGGRIALHYDTNEQDAADLVSLTLDAAPGSYNGSWRNTSARPGTVWASDMKMFKFAGSPDLKGALACADVREMTFPGMTVTNTYLSFVEQVTNVHVTGDLVVGGNTTRFWFGAVKPVYGSAERYGFTSTDAISYVLTIDGDLKVENGAAVDLHPARTNGLDGVDGAYVNVAGDFEVGCDGGSVTSIVRYAAHPVVGSTVHVAARNATVGLRGWLFSDNLGWANARTTYSARGPGRGQSGNTGDDWARIIGAGHGGLGVRGGNLVSGVAYGLTYDSEVRPLMAGSSGSHSWGTATESGGYVYLRAERKITVAGQITANATDTAADRSSAGSGGGILLEAHNAEVQSTARITAKGSSHSNNSYTGLGPSYTVYDVGGAAGGGGRISIVLGQPWSPRMRPWHYKSVEANTVVADGAVISVAGGLSGTNGTKPPAEDGTFGVYNRAITGTMLILR